MSKKNKILSYVLIFFPLVIFIIEVSSLFFTRGNNINRLQTKYDAITGWREKSVKIIIQMFRIKNF